jgi:DNA-binding response OmpR family regulator
MQRVLSVGYGLPAFKRRNEALTAAGLTVREATNLEAALRMLERENFQVLLLGPALPGEDRNKIARVARERRPQIKIIMLYDGRIAGAELADAIIADDDPQRVLDTIQLFGNDTRSATECA